MMPMELAAAYRGRADAEEAAAIISACVDCGQCMPYCSTHRLLADDWDGPRGRVRLMRQHWEGQPPAADLQTHLDRCLTCRACEATCPEGVRYGRLLDLTRTAIEPHAARPFKERLLRRALRAVVPHRARFAALLGLGRTLRRFVPATLRAKILPPRPAGAWPQPANARTLLVWPGCVQPALAPDINAAAARVLARCGIRLEAANTGCCGALSHHMAAPEEALVQMRRNIDAIWPQIEAGAEALVMTASGCGAHVRDYGALLAGDPRYAERAARLSAMTRDIAEIVADELQAGRMPALPKLPPAPERRVAFQSPCSLQHAQRIKGVVERILKYASYQPTLPAHPFLCCGAAGSYALLQPELADGLRKAKLDTLLSTRPKLIVTANIGCLTHLTEASPLPVKHWIELLDEAIAAAERAAATSTAQGAVPPPL